MKQVLWMCMILIGIGATGCGRTGYSAEAPTAAAGGQKVGFVDFQRALNETDVGKRAKAELKKVYDQRQQELQGLQKQLEAMKTELEKNRLTLNADALKQKEESYRQKFLELNQKLGDYKSELDQKESEKTGAILTTLKQVATRIGKEGGYSMILEKSQDVVLYSPVDADITDQVIRAYNAGAK